MFGGQGQRGLRATLYDQANLVETYGPQDIDQLKNGVEQSVAAMPIAGLYVSTDAYKELPVAQVKQGRRGSYGEISLSHGDPNGVGPSRDELDRHVSLVTTLTGILNMFRPDVASPGPEVNISIRTEHHLQIVLKWENGLEITAERIRFQIYGPGGETLGDENNDSSTLSVRLIAAVPVASDQHEVPQRRDAPC